MADEKLEIVILVKDLATRSLTTLKRGLGGLRSGIRSLSGAVFSLQGAMLSLGGGLVARSFLNVAVSFEQMEKQLDQLTKGKGTETLEKINTWAKSMPVDTQQAVSAFVQMQAFGLNPTLEKMEILTDVATVMGQHAFPRVSRALGQMAALGKVSAEELNQLSEVGINARKILADAFGQTVEEVQRSGRDINEVIDAIWAGLEGEFGGASVRALESWQGIMNVLKSYWLDFQKTVADSGVFEFLKAGVTLLLKEVQKLEKSGKLAEWAQETSDSVVSALKLIAQAGAIVADVFWGWKIIWNGLKSAFAVLAAYLNKGFAKLDEIQTKMFTSLADKIAKAASIIDRLDPTQLTKGMTEAAKEAASYLKSIGGLQPMYEENEKIWWGIADAAVKELDALTAQESSLTVVNRIIENITREMQRQTKETKKQTAEADKKKKFADPTSSPAAKAAAELQRLNADTARGLQEVQNLFDQGKLSAEEYYNARVVAANQTFIAEQNLLQLQFEAAKKLDQKEAINAKIYANEQKHQQDLFQLNLDRIKNIEAAQLTAYQKEKAFADLKARELAAQSSQSDITSQFTMELLAMDEKHAEEIEKLKQHKADMGLIEETFRIQQLEKDKLLADQKIQLQEMILNATSEVLGDTANAFQSLYETTGKQSKEFFAIYKATAIAQTIIDTYKGATSAFSAMAGIPYVGPALGTAAAAAAIAAGIARVEMIRQQEFGAAEGGLIPGQSPHAKADNLSIRATAGEFMQPVSAVKYYGKNVMEAIRRNAVPRNLLAGFAMPSARHGMGRFAQGGVVTPPGGSDAVEDRGLTINNIVDPTMMDQHIQTTPGQKSIMNVLSENQFALKQLVLTG